MIQLWDMKLRHSVIVSQCFEVGITEYEGTMFLRNVGNRLPGDAESVTSHKNRTLNPTAVKPFKKSFQKVLLGFVCRDIASPRNTKLHSTDTTDSPANTLHLVVLKASNVIRFEI